jgi:DNA repair photolyase
VDYLGDPPHTELEVFEGEAKSILSAHDNPDIPVRWSVTPYRGCFHSCASCYARPTHHYLGWDAGTDFERRIVVKTNAAPLLREALQERTWRGELVAFSGVTDCYQSLEACYELTRQCLRVCLQQSNPIAVITKGALVDRDAELIAAIHARAGASVYLSIPFADDEMGRRMEPFDALPSRRQRALARLSAAGIPTGVAIAPVIPGLNDDQIPRILTTAREAGAERAFMTMLRLPGEVAQVFEQRLREAAPLRTEKVMGAVREMRRGASSSNTFGERMRGTGPRWRAVENLFNLSCRRLGFLACEEDRHTPPRRGARQGMLFEK